jgi:DNA mismatch repair protein MutL
MVASAIDGTDEVEKTARESMALTMANASAIVYGQVLSAVEMNRLLADLFSLPSSARTPDGKVICSIIDAKSIEKLF